MSIEQYYSPKEIAALLHISERTIWRWLKDRRVTCVKIEGCVRIKESELKRLLAACQIRRRPRASILTQRFPLA